jgi:hypothetical protein
MSSESNFAFFYFFGLSNNSGNVMGRVGVSIISIYVGMWWGAWDLRLSH